MDFPGGSDIKCLPTMQETWVWSLGQEDSLKKKMATHSSILAWKIPWTEEPDGLQSTGSQRVGHDWETSLHFTKSNDWYRVGKALGWWRQRLRHHTLWRLQGSIFSCLFEFWLAQVLVFWCLCWHLYFGLLTSITGKEYLSAAWSHQVSGNLLR